mgnify:CR=1 FL=1
MVCFKLYNFKRLVKIGDAYKNDYFSNTFNLTKKMKDAF